jgi:hypothetical protein
MDCMAAAVSTSPVDEASTMAAIMAAAAQKPGVGAEFIIASSPL